MAQYDFYAERRVSPLGRWLNQRLHRKVKDCLISSGINIVEIGTGRGELAQSLIDCGCNYHGYEPSKGLAHICKAQNIPVHQCYCPPLLEETNSQDMVVLIHVFEHLPNLDLAQALLSEINRILRVGGRILLVAPDICAWGGAFWDSDATHTFPTSLRKVNQLLGDAGFEIITAKYIYGSLGFIVGYPCWKLSQLIIMALDPIRNAMPMRFKFLAKLETLFIRSIWIESRKKTSSVTS